MNKIFTTVRRALFPPRRRQVGADHLGNAYFEQLDAHESGRPRRTVIAQGLGTAEHAQPQLYQSSNIPGT